MSGKDHGQALGALVGVRNEHRAYRHMGKRPKTAWESFEPGPMRDTAIAIENQVLPFPPDVQERVVRLMWQKETQGFKPEFMVDVVRGLKLMRPHQQDRFLTALEENDQRALGVLIDEAKADADGSLTARKLTAAREIVAVAQNPKLQKLGESCFHKCVEAWNNQTVILPNTEGVLPEHLAGALGHNATVFVVQHDWAAAFEHATDFADGEFKLTYPETVYEFRISGKRVCASLTSHDDGSPHMCMLNIETSVGWTLGAMYGIQRGQWRKIADPEDICAPILNLVRDQIRAICIALEAEVAVSEIVRAPHRLNAKRERRGQLPIYDFHAVSLANRRRYVLRDVQPGDIEDEHRKRRMHFVRGHWRHYANIKSWVKWHLRGSPDLGFIDKEYRL